jgi:uncharacterized Zn finger protein
MEEPSRAGVAKAPTAGATPRLLAATLFCENCGEATPHRILRLDPRSRLQARRVSGVARCRVCQFTHPFESNPEDRVEVGLVVSTGPRSERALISLPRFRKLQVATGVPDSDRPLTIHRIEDRKGRSLRHALAEDVATLWATHDEGAVVPVSVVEGSRTHTVRKVWPPESLLEVGGRLEVDRSEIRIYALRALGRTWRRPGDRFRALEVSRVYGRRTDSPPAGRRDWRRGRGIPSSRTNSTSRSERSRSGPGMSTTRTVPRRRRASGGAAVQRLSPS